MSLVTASPLLWSATMHQCYRGVWYLDYIYIHSHTHIPDLLSDQLFMEINLFLPVLFLWKARSFDADSPHAAYIQKASTAGVWIVNNSLWLWTFSFQAINYVFILLKKIGPWHAPDEAAQSRMPPFVAISSYAVVWINSWDLIDSDAECLCPYLIPHCILLSWWSNLVVVSFAINLVVRCSAGLASVQGTALIPDDSGCSKLSLKRFWNCLKRKRLCKFKTDWDAQCALVEKWVLNLRHRKTKATWLRGDAQYSHLFCVVHKSHEVQWSLSCKDKADSQLEEKLFRYQTVEAGILYALCHLDFHLVTSHFNDPCGSTGFLPAEKNSGHVHRYLYLSGQAPLSASLETARHTKWPSTDWLTLWPKKVITYETFLESERKHSQRLTAPSNQYLFHNHRPRLLTVAVLLIQRVLSFATFCLLLCFLLFPDIPVEWSLQTNARPNSDISVCKWNLLSPKCSLMKLLNRADHSYQLHLKLMIIFINVLSSAKILKSKSLFYHATESTAAADNALLLLQSRHSLNSRKTSCSLFLPWRHCLDSMCAKLFIAAAGGVLRIWPSVSSWSIEISLFVLFCFVLLFRCMTSAFEQEELFLRRVLKSDNTRAHVELKFAFIVFKHSFVRFLSAWSVVIKGSSLLDPDN